MRCCGLTPQFFQGLECVNILFALLFLFGNRDGDLPHLLSCKKKKDVCFKNMNMKKKRMSRLNKDFQEVCEFYVQSLIDTIGKQHAHIDVAELQSIWKDIIKPARKLKKKKIAESTPTPAMNLEYEKRKNQLANMRYDDLYRHCVRNGLQPPNNKDDMVKVILTRMYSS